MDSLDSKPHLTTKASQGSQSLPSLPEAEVQTVHFLARMTSMNLESSR